MAVELVYHASKGNSNKVSKLLEAGIHPDACNNNGETALFHAVLAGKTTTAKVLLKYGADPNRCSINGLSPVNASCLQDNVKALALLVKYGGNLDTAEDQSNESAFVSAHRYHSTKIIKYITKLKEDAIMNFKISGELDDAIDVGGGSERKQNTNKLKKNEKFPGDFASIPCIDIEDLKTLHEGKRFCFSAPNVTFRSGIWHRVEVTIKSLNKKDYAEYMKREMELLRVLRHPNVAYLLAVITGPVDDQISSILEHFPLGNLNHLLHHSDEELNLFERFHVLLDISKAMCYLHSLNIIHCYINSYSVLLQGKCQAKLGNFEHAQKANVDAANEFEEFSSVSDIVDQHPWMCYEELSGYPASKYGDVYSFGALLWECLTKHVPWSWLKNKTIIVAVCEEGSQLPILEEWPDFITDVLCQCLGMEEEKPDFYSIKKQLDCIKTSGWLIKTYELDDAFDEWLYGKAKRKASGRGRTISGPLASKISWKISGFSIGNVDLSCEDDSKVRVLCSRRKSSMTSNLKHRRKTVNAGLAGALNALRVSENQMRFERDVDNYGIEIAEQLSFVRGIWKKAKSHTRHRWAKEVAIRRKLEGDIERVNTEKRIKESNQTAKGQGRKQGRRIRRLSHGAESIARLRTIATKYGKWDWARYTTGHAYTLPQEKYEMLSDEEYDDDDVERVPIETGGTFVQYQGGKSVEKCQIVPSKIRGISLGQIIESEESDSSYEIIVRGIDEEETVHEHWQKEVDNGDSKVNQNGCSCTDSHNEPNESQEFENKEFSNREITASESFNKENNSGQIKHLEVKVCTQSNDESNRILNDFSSWIDNVADTNNSKISQSESVSNFHAERVSRQSSRKEFLDKMVDKYNSQLQLYQDAKDAEDDGQGETSLLEELIDTYDNTTTRDLSRTFSSFIERSSSSEIGAEKLNLPSSNPEDQASNSMADTPKIQSQREADINHKESEAPTIAEGEKETLSLNKKNNTIKEKFEPSSKGRESANSYKSPNSDGLNRTSKHSTSSHTTVSKIASIISSSGDSLGLEKGDQRMVKSSISSKDNISTRSSSTSKFKAASSKLKYPEDSFTSIYGQIVDLGSANSTEFHAVSKNLDSPNNSKMSITKSILPKRVDSWSSDKSENVEPKSSFDEPGISFTSSATQQDDGTISYANTSNGKLSPKSTCTPNSEDDFELESSDQVDFMAKVSATQENEGEISSVETSSTNLSLNLSWTSNEEDDLKAETSYGAAETSARPFQNEDDVSFVKTPSNKDLSLKDSSTSNELEDDLESVSSGDDKPSFQLHEGEVSFFDDVLEGVGSHAQSTKHSRLSKGEEAWEQESSGEEQNEGELSFLDDMIGQYGARMEINDSIQPSSSRRKSSSGMMELVDRYSFRRDGVERNTSSDTSTKQMEIDDSIQSSSSRRKSSSGLMELVDRYSFRRDGAERNRANDTSTNEDSEGDSV